MSNSRYLSASEAAAELGITPATLYAYVSRGLIRSQAAEGDTRARRYSAEDVARLKARRETRRSPESVAESALQFGTPVLESAICLIDGGMLYYRGLDAVVLAQQASVEDVAALIWMGDVSADVPGLRGKFPLRLSPRLQHIHGAVADLAPVERLQILLPLAAAEDLAAYDLRPGAVAAAGARILRLAAAVISGQEANDEPVARTIQRGWLPYQPEAERLISAALVLCADHELNASSFTARCVASTNATPYQAVIGGLAALQGPKHGGHTGRVEAFLDEIRSPEAVEQAVAARLRRGESISGFGHTLYPEGDPRGAALLRLVADAYPNSPAVALSDALSQSVFRLIGDYPTIDLALVTLCRALDLPAGSAIALFAVGRIIGWVGHAVEQYALDSLIRPRARYTGNLPT